MLRDIKIQRRGLKCSFRDKISGQPVSKPVAEQEYLPCTGKYSGHMLFQPQQLAGRPCGGGLRLTGMTIDFFRAEMRFDFHCLFARAVVKPHYRISERFSRPVGEYQRFALRINRYRIDLLSSGNTSYAVGQHFHICFRVAFHPAAFGDKPVFRRA